jgi:hypothetical protein
MIYGLKPILYKTLRDDFSHAGIVAFYPEKVLSHLQIVINEATPILSRPSTLSNAHWSPKTSYNACTLERQAKSVKTLLNLTSLDRESPSSHAFNQLIKGFLVTIIQEGTLGYMCYTAVHKGTI